MNDPRIVTVCTANICRSPATAVLLRRGLAGLFPGAQISSVGTAARNGSPACDRTSALLEASLAARYPGMPLTRYEREGHRSRLMVRQDFEEAALILALDRSHRSAVAQLVPSSRSRTFTLRQAAAAAAEVTKALRTGRLPEGAPPLPDGPAGRFEWFVQELDAHRAFLHPQPIKSRGSLAIDPLDVPDPHVLGFALHPLAVELIEQASSALVEGLAALAELGARQR